MFFDPTITQILRDTLPWAGTFFKIMTELGGELVYIGLILTGYWAYRKRESLITAMILLVAVLSNYWLKMAIANPRPDEATYWLEGVEATHYSTPSGHAQYSATIYSWFAVRVRTWWMFAVSILLTTLIGISRVYLGVHYLGDVLLGWGIGVFVVVILYYFKDSISNFIARIGIDQACVILFLVGFLLTVISLFIPFPPETNFGNAGGLTMGLAVGIPLERRFVSFSTEAPNGQKWRLVVRVLVGLILVVGLLSLLAPLLPSEILLLRTVRYFIVTVFGLFIWPLVFKRAGI